MLNFIKEIDAEDIGTAGFIALIVSALFLVIIAISADHAPKKYYLGAVYEGRCAVYANNPWETDDKVFHSANINECLGAIFELNQGIK